MERWPTIVAVAVALSGPLSAALVVGVLRYRRRQRLQHLGAAAAASRARAQHLFDDTVTEVR